MKKFKVDARNLDCPKPLLRTKEAIEQQNFESLEILVSNMPARDNVMRFLNHSAFSNIISKELENGDIQILGDKENTAESVQKVDIISEENKKTEGKVVLIADKGIGKGDPTLSQLLMKGYLYTLTELEQTPSVLIFMNSGVMLTLKDSESLDDLKTLEARGVEILVCGTCLDFLSVRENLAVGEISNMYSIAEKLHSPHGVISLS